VPPEKFTTRYNRPFSNYHNTAPSIHSNEIYTKIALMKRKKKIDIYPSPLQPKTRNTTSLYGSNLMQLHQNGLVSAKS
jgi:hypothetical protein